MPELYSDLDAGPGGFRVCGSFGLDGANNPPASSIKGPFSVVRTAIGIYTVTLKGVRFLEVTAFLPQLQLAVYANSGVMGGPVDLTLAAGQTFQIFFGTAGVAANPPAAGANVRMHFEIRGVRSPI